MALTEFQKGTGAVKDAPDARDFQWSEVAFGDPPFDWSKEYDIEKLIGVMPVKDQGVSFSCGGQAWASYATAQEALATGTLEERSAKYIYAQTFVPGGGSSGRDNSEIYKKQGVAREGMLSSYDRGQPPSEAFMERRGDITAQATQDAKRDTSTAYVNIAVDIDLIAQAIRNCQGVVLGITGSNNGSWLDKTPFAPKDGETFWYHWVYAGKVKMINGRKFIGILNSWGTDTGDKGWQWLNEEYVASMLRSSPYGRGVWGCWAHVHNDLPVVTPEHVFLEDLQIGDIDVEVMYAQQLLQKDGDFPASVAPTNYFGNVTLAAVKKYQIKYGIASPDTPGYGRIGPKTRASFNKLTTSSGAAPTALWGWLSGWWH